MELPKVISFSSMQGDHAGFMLLAPNVGGETGTCVFMLTPTSSVGIDSDMGVIISELKVAGEHQFKFMAVSGGFSLTVFPRELPEVELQLNNELNGGVISIMRGIKQRVGSAEPLRSA